MIDPSHELPVSAQSELLKLSISSHYYKARPMTEADLELMQMIDRLHLGYPFAGARMLRDLLRARGLRIGRRHVGTLMRKMAVEATYRRPFTSLRNAAHRVFPYLLRDLTITQQNHVWCADITYIPMSRGFIYLFAVLDWATPPVSG